MRENQVFITSGGFHVGLPKREDWSGMVVSSRGIEHHKLIHNHEESDTQIFLHVFDSHCSYILVYSIDRDVGIIVLPLDFHNKSVCVQYNAKVGEEKYVNINVLQDAIRADSDLSCILAQNIDVFKCIQMLYISSGCDFVSFFAKLGKSTFYNKKNQYSSFITGESNQDTHGNLTCTVNKDSEIGLLAFYRLVLFVYFKANRACLHEFDMIAHFSCSIVCLGKQLWNNTKRQSILSGRHHGKGYTKMNCCLQIMSYNFIG